MYSIIEDKDWRFTNKSRLECLKNMRGEIICHNYSTHDVFHQRGI